MHACWRHLVVSVTLQLDDESTWPVDLVHIIEQHIELFDDWYGPTAEARERDRAPGDIQCGPSFSAKEHDRALSELQSVLSRHSIGPGFHCTRLTEAERSAIRESGMQPQNGERLRVRIQALASAGLIPEAVTSELVVQNYANDRCRAGKIWFCFFETHSAGESGISRFFRYWGGEALYGTHECSVSTRAALQGIGTPSIVVADVSVGSLSPSALPGIPMVRRYFQNRGARITESVNYEAYTTAPVPPQAIDRILRYPEPEFFRLTRCDSWRISLQAAE